MLLFVIIVLAIFMVASTLYQIKYFQKYLNKYDKFNLLPNYSFFAPKPYANDFRLVYKLNEGSDSNWEELDMYKEFGLKRILWNPFKYYNKGMIDICQYLIQEQHVLKDKDLLKSSAHHMNIILSIYRFLKDRNIEAEAVKFAIVTSEGCKDLKIKSLVFCSNFQNI
ncbi:hypothetical protein [Flavobacterium sp. CLA17]|uniref:hypothetical protein n=1 Tax=Flavobacterium sp. CLA17 TaxID=2724135 RepID=UPI001490DB9F|nr:hypothetical protein [Flavobacterium sp. CLA17]QSB25415.1 hypothetical protein HAV12_013640 [Flavobacterium sp. CLA17]